MAYRRPEPLAKEHIRAGFDCGEPALNDWLERHAPVSQASGTGRVFVTTETGSRQVIGYYALAPSQVEAGDATPVVLLARLAVDLSHQNRGVGRSLLQDAVVRTIGAAEAVGIRAILIHAKGDAAREWYAQYGFESSPSDPLHMVTLLEDARATVEGLAEKSSG